jgi:hypothetical protein
VPASATARRAARRAARPGAGRRRARGKRGNRHRVLLYSVVARANDVLVNVAHDSTYVLGFGHRADLEVVERLWASLAVQMTAAAQRRLDRGSTGPRRGRADVAAVVLRRLGDRRRRAPAGCPRACGRGDAGREPASRPPPWCCATRPPACRTSTPSSRRPAGRGGVRGRGARR